MRIVSSVPSITELVASFNAGQLVGRTRFCTEPQSIAPVTVVGGTKNLNLATIRKLHPDVIFAVREENSKDQIEQLMNEFNVVLFDIETVGDALKMIEIVGSVMKKEDLATDLIYRIRVSFRSLDFNDQIPVLYLIWDNPVMSVGGDTFIHDMLSQAGFRNVLGHQCRYPVVDLDKDLSVEPQIIILSSEPYPFQEKHLARFRQRFPLSTVVLADGAMFSWYGNRMELFPDFITQFRHRNAL